jgi:nucleoside-diphosphate-sugar epimerase
VTAPVLVTGATGFLGTPVVAALLAAGHRVRAVVRPGTAPAELPWSRTDQLELARVDLRRREGLDDAVAGTSAVVHLAAVKSGDFALRFAGTVVATEHLLDAMTGVGVDRLVFCSTFSVYDYRALPPGSTLTEDSPVEDEPLTRDEYAQVKLLQEQLVRAWPGRTTVVRPGMIYGPDELWHSLLGVEIAGPWWLGAGTHRVLPMAWVENVADAFVAAVERAEAVGATVNVVDDDLPNVGEYLAAVTPLVTDPPHVVPLPYRATDTLVATLDAANRALFHGRAKLPSGLRPAPFAARFRPLRYSNARAKEVLGWAPRVDLTEAVTRARDARSAAARREGASA